MALKFSDSLGLLLVVFLFISGKVMSGGNCYLSSSPGGCPDMRKCAETCGPCYRGVGSVVASCVAASGPNIIGECRCTFYGGAPCPPVGGPKCPGNPGLSPLSRNSTIASNTTLL